MKILAIGFRGLPGIQGGIEMHAEKLYPILVNLGCSVEVVGRMPYMPKQSCMDWKGVRLRSFWSPRSKRLETIIHSLLCVLYAALSRPDVLHIHGIGPALVTPFARFLGLRVVVTHHGPDYDRQKWGAFAKTALRMGERFGMRFSNRRIVISEVIRSLVEKKYHSESMLIPNGVVLPDLPKKTETLDRFGLRQGKYILLVSRLVPEKRHLDLIEAFRRAAICDWNLVIVGGADHVDSYSKEVLSAASSTAGVVCTGFQSGESLAELYGHAGLFVLPSSHEGLPIALLEALSYGLPVLASDIPANREVGLPAESYFPLGATDCLASKLAEFSNCPLTDDDRSDRRAWVRERYNWDAIAEKTLVVFNAACGA